MNTILRNRILNGTFAFIVVLSIWQTLSVGLVNMSAEDHTYKFLCSIRNTFWRK